ncbi:hypothetical protein DXG01_006641 [Tephrocybe rancida]|nr:hypothetical protein DXG01_006641 [Tephrocybe rancida]
MSQRDVNSTVRKAAVHINSCPGTAPTIQYHFKFYGPDYLDGIVDGKTWANGPMHSGGFGPSTCLAPGAIPGASAKRIAAGVAIGSLIAGLTIGAVIAFIFRRRREKGELSSTSFHDRPLPPIPSKLSTWLGDSMLLGTRHPRPLDDGLHPFTPHRPRVELMETKGLALQDQARIVRIPIRFWDSNEATTSRFESPPSYDYGADTTTNGSGMLEGEGKP